ncbi:MAG: hypothetical protein L6Q35_13595 [Phycisphaerales bacterium]|nr:hypothetical protein [Phycisphaerales bacterium]
MKGAAKPAAKSSKAAAKPASKLAKPAPKTAASKAPPAKVVAKPVAKGTPSKPVATKPAATKPGAAKAPPAKPQASKAPAGKAAPPPAANGKGGRKGITIVQPKPVKKAKPKPRAPMSGAHAVPSMHGGRSSAKPLIPSGPAASPTQPLGYHGGAADGPRHDFKSPFGKRELAHFRQILLQKRAELVRDVSSMESEALKGGSGSLSSLPQHLAEQGSETYDQSLSLDLAAADRKLIREIDDALQRIDAGTYGVCEINGKPIKMERLEELPWARHSIEAARDLERRQMRL